MKRRHFLGQLLCILPALAAGTALLAACAPRPVKPGLLGRLQQPAGHWRSLISPAAWDVLFREDTESRFSSQLYYEKGMGTYVCAACHLPLFASAAKYDSGTGWPSFWRALPDALEISTDASDAMMRSEYHCTRCGGHHGHVFDDGPPPTGLRYCSNGAALTFVEAGQPLPPLRS